MSPQQAAQNSQGRLSDLYNECLKKIAIGIADSGGCSFTCYLSLHHDDYSKIVQRLASTLGRKNWSIKSLKNKNDRQQTWVQVEINPIEEESYDQEKY